jgi:hypothetical protein
MSLPRLWHTSFRDIKTPDAARFGQLLLSLPWCL